MTTELIVPRHLTEIACETCGEVVPIMDINHESGIRVPAEDIGYVATEVNARWRVLHEKHLEAHPGRALVVNYGDRGL